MNNSDMNFVNLFRMIKAIHNLTTTELAEELGMAQSNMSDIATGKRNPGLQILERTARRFNIPMSNMFSFVERAGTTSSASELAYATWRLFEYEDDSV